MKQVLILFVIALYIPSAFAWQKELDCDGGKNVIDYDDHGNSGSPFQMVIRDPSVVEYFMNSSAALGYRRNQSGEIVLPLSVNRNSSPLHPEFIGEMDAYQTNGRVYFVKPMGESLVLEAFRTTQPTGGLYVQREKITDWTFRACRH